MEQRMKISDQITVGPQPAADEFEQLKEQGFRSIVNLRTEGEEEQPLTPEEEGRVVRDLGLEYLNIPVSMKEIKPDQVDRFRSELARLPKPMFAHCKGGKRAGAFAMMHIACEQGMSGDATLQQAMDMGFECDKPELKEFVRKYVDDHVAVSH